MWWMRKTWGYRRRLPRQPRPRMECIPTPRHKKLRNAPPILRHRPPQTCRRRIQWYLTPRAHNLRCQPPRLRHRLLRTPRPRIKCIPTPKHKNLWRTPRRLRHRQHRTPRPPIRWFSMPRAKNLRCAPPRLRHRLPRTPSQALDAVRHLEVKDYGAQHLDSVIGHPKHLDHALNIYLYLNATTNVAFRYEAFHVNSPSVAQNSAVFGSSSN